MQSFEDKMLVKKIPPKNVTIISLGFNRCGEVLFFTSMELGKYSQYLTREYKDKYPNLKSAIVSVRQILEQFLIKETKNADIVELCVGAVQQDIPEDRQRGQKNNNGSCFSLYKKLAERKKWIFNKILLADFEDEEGKARIPALEPGSAMDSSMIKGPVDVEKKKILYRQIEHVADKYPNDKIKFIFIDGQEGNFPLLKHYFEDRVIKNYLLSRINELKLVHYSSEEMIKTHSPLRQPRWYIKKSVKHLLQQQCHLTQNDLEPYALTDSRLLKILETNTSNAEILPKHFELFSPSPEMDSLRTSLESIRKNVQAERLRFFQNEREDTIEKKLLEVTTNLTEVNYNYRLLYATFVFFACFLTFVSCKTMFLLSDLIKRGEDPSSENFCPSF